MQSKSFVLALALLTSTIGFGSTHWIKENEAKQSCKKYPACKACKGLGYKSLTVKIGDPKYNLRSFYPKESPNNTKKVFVQCESCLTGLEEERKRKIAEKDKMRIAKGKALQEEKQVQFTAIAASLIGAVDEVGPELYDNGRWSEWRLTYQAREKDKDYSWTVSDAKLMPARCPVVFQVIDSKSFLVKSPVNDTLVIIDTLKDYEVPDGKPFLCWGTYRYMGVKSYTSIIGAKKTVPWIVQVK